jgi:hypothetical protein
MEPTRADKTPKKYWVLWTYLANHSERPIEVEAETALHACQLATSIFSDDFKQKGTVYVFDTAPVFVRRPRAE